MLRALLETLFHYFKRADTKRPYNLANAVNFLLSVDALNAVRYSIRSPPNFGYLNEECQNLVYRIINSPGSLEIDPSEISIVHSLMDRCIIRWAEGTSESAVCFISPAVYRIAIAALCGSPRPIKEVATLTEFLMATLPRIRKDFLQQNLGVGADALLEPTWQIEFYRAATSVLTVNSHISPSVRRLFGSSGQLDFYVNGTKRWLVEITRGSLLEEHGERFQHPHGRYSNIPRKASVVLDRVFLMIAETLC